MLIAATISLAMYNLIGHTSNERSSVTGLRLGNIYICACVCVCKLSNYFLTFPGSTSHGPGSTSHSPGSMSHGLQLPEMIGLVVGVLLVTVTVTIALVAVLVVILSTFITQTKQNVFIALIFSTRSS